MEIHSLNCGGGATEHLKRSRFGQSAPLRFHPVIKGRSGFCPHPFAVCCAAFINRCSGTIESVRVNCHLRGRHLSISHYLHHLILDGGYTCTCFCAFTKAASTPARRRVKIQAQGLLGCAFVDDAPHAEKLSVVRSHHDEVGPLLKSRFVGDAAVAFKCRSFRCSDLCLQCWPKIDSKQSLQKLTPDKEKQFFNASLQAPQSLVHLIFRKLNAKSFVPVIFWPIEFPAGPGIVARYSLPCCGTRGVETTINMRDPEIARVKSRISVQ